MGNNGPRFQAKEGAAGHGCCYEAHVVDTTIQFIVCETYSIQQAIEIADALNARAMQHG